MLLSERNSYDKIIYQQHLKRVNSMLPTIDTSAPKRIHFVDHRRRDERKIKDKKIHQENTQLLLNIAKVIQTSNIDNNLSKHVKDTRKFTEKMLRIKRTNESKKITIANLQLLQRIQNVQPTIHF